VQTRSSPMSRAAERSKVTEAVDRGARPAGEPGARRSTSTPALREGSAGLSRRQRAIREGDPADACTSSRRAGSASSGSTRPTEIIRAEVGRGDLVGEMALITNRPRIRDRVRVARHASRLSAGAFSRLSAGSSGLGPPDRQ
jgi:CRP-like cAMP-binding protein